VTKKKSCMKHTTNRDFTNLFYTIRLVEAYFFLFKCVRVTYAIIVNLFFCFDKLEERL